MGLFAFIGVGDLPAERAGYPRIIRTKRQANSATELPMLRDLQVVFQVPYHKDHYSGIRHLERLFLLEAPPKIDLGETKKIIVELNVDKNERPGLSEAYGFATIQAADFEIRNYERFSAAEKQEYIVRILSSSVECVLNHHGQSCKWVGQAAEKIRKEGYTGVYQSRPKPSKSRKLKADISWWYAAGNCGIKAKITRKKNGVILKEVMHEGFSTREMENHVREMRWDGESLICAGTRYPFPDEEK